MGRSCYLLSNHGYMGFSLRNLLSRVHCLGFFFGRGHFFFSFIHIFLVIMDGWSRYQNYKRAKDQFYIHGFNNKIALNYIDSKCQRMAAKTAAEELGMKDQIENYYKNSGVKWFHYIPYFMIKEPFFLLKKIFWSRTFLEGHYEPKYDYQAIFKLQAV